MTEGIRLRIEPLKVLPLSTLALRLDRWFSGPRKSCWAAGCFILLLFVGITGDARPEELESLLEPIRKKHGLPALAAIVVARGKTVALGATGVRKIGTQVRVTRQDAFHIGSCTKAMTATLLAMLVERGRLRWTNTLAEIFAEQASTMQPAYRTVTLKHLLAHRSGLPPNKPKGKTLGDLRRLPGTPKEQRAAYVRMLLEQPPQAEPGSRYLYSNAGYAVAAAMAERATGKAWEDLMREMLFEPLGMESAGFGAMGVPGKIEQPWQHRIEKGKPVAVEPGPHSDNPSVLGPAGRVHCSMGDWARFITAHLEGAQGRESLLKRETFRVLHTPAFGGDYALGWGVKQRSWAGGRVLTHTGSNTMNYAVVWMAPLRDFAVLVATNQGGDVAPKACDEAAAALVRKYVVAKDK